MRVILLSHEDGSKIIFQNNYLRKYSLLWVDLNSVIQVQPINSSNCRHNIVRNSVRILRVFEVVFLRVCSVLLLRRDRECVGRELTPKFSRDLEEARVRVSKWANRVLPCLFQRFYKCYRGRRAAGAWGRWGFVSSVRAVARATPRRAPSRPTINTTAASHRASSALTVACLARRSSMCRTISGTSTRPNWSSVTRSSRTSRAAAHGTRD